MLHPLLCDHVGVLSKTCPFNASVAYIGQLSGVRFCVSWGAGGSRCTTAARSRSNGDSKSENEIQKYQTYFFASLWLNISSIGQYAMLCFIHSISFLLPWQCTPPPKRCAHALFGNLWFTWTCLYLLLQSTFIVTGFAWYTSKDIASRYRRCHVIPLSFHKPPHCQSNHPPPLAHS